MPGHKNNKNLIHLILLKLKDLTIYIIQKVILDLMEDFSSLYNSERTFLSTNGSTAGILAAISAVAEI